MRKGEIANDVTEGDMLHLSRRTSGNANWFLCSRKSRCKLEAASRRPKCNRSCVRTGRYGEPVCWRGRSREEIIPRIRQDLYWLGAISLLNIL
jgi:hypothetical protein